MTLVQQVCQQLDALAPPGLAEEWDNTGLLVGDPSRECRRVMTCLTLTSSSVREAIDRRADLVVSHHPLPFRPLKRLTTASQEGELLWRLAGAGIGVYSPHTAYDSAPSGVNQLLCAALRIEQPRPLVPSADFKDLGAGRIGMLAKPATLDEFALVVKSALGAESVRVVGAPDAELLRVAVACGSGGSLLAAAVNAGAQALVTGEATFHNCLAAEHAGVALILPGHYASERFAVERLADWLLAALPGLEVWASKREADPLRTM